VGAGKDRITQVVAGGLIAAEQENVTGEVRESYDGFPEGEYGPSYWAVLRA